MSKLTQRNIRFCNEYVKSFIQTDAYLIVYPNKTRKSAMASSSRLMNKREIKEYIKILAKKSGKINDLKRAEKKYITEINNVGYIYLLKIAGTNFYKIGKSKYKDARVKQLATIMPFDFKLEALIYIKDYESTEKELHKLYNNNRVKGEWFEFDITKLNKVLVEYSKLQNKQGFKPVKVKVIKEIQYKLFNE